MDNVNSGLLKNRIKNGEESNIKHPLFCPMRKSSSAQTPTQLGEGNMISHESCDSAGRSERVPAGKLAPILLLLKPRLSCILMLLKSPISTTQSSAVRSLMSSGAEGKLQTTEL